MSAKWRGEHLGTEGRWRDDFGETLGLNEPRSNSLPRPQHLRPQVSWIVYRLYGEHQCDVDRWGGGQTYDGTHAGPIIISMILVAWFSDITT